MAREGLRQAGEWISHPELGVRQTRAHPAKVTSGTHWERQTNGHGREGRSETCSEETGYRHWREYCVVGECQSDCWLRNHMGNCVYL